MPAVNNVATSAGYSDIATMSISPPARTLTIVVTNAAVYAQFRFTEVGRTLHPEAYSWEPDERFLIPGVWLFTEQDFNGQFIVGVRARSALGTAPAQVSLHA
jgi:hypothetical protein